MSELRDEIIALYEKLVATQPGLKIKGKTARYTSMNGHMFSFVTKEGDGAAIRLSKADGAAFDEKYGTEPVIQYGSVMRGYVALSKSMLERTDEMAPYLAASIDYIASLEPKPTTKPKKKPAKKS